MGKVCVCVAPWYVVRDFPPLSLETICRCGGSMSLLISLSSPFRPCLISPPPHISLATSSASSINTPPITLSTRSTSRKKIYVFTYSNHSSACIMEREEVQERDACRCTVITPAVA